MKAMLLEKIQEITKDSSPLVLRDINKPVTGDKQLLIKVKVCGVCHTEIDEIEGRTPPGNLPVVPGHQVVGEVDGKGADVKNFSCGDRVGVAWIYYACGSCHHCREGMENLCDSFKATGRDASGGYAEYMVVDERFAHAIPDSVSNEEIAPMLCAGAIGYRSLNLCNLNNGDPLGLTGFGASAHIVIKLVNALYPDSEVYVFARSPEQRSFAAALGAIWTGDIPEYSPVKLKAIIDTTPVWKPVVESMKNLQKGGRLVINAIRKEKTDIGYLKKLDYGEHLWYEKEIKSVANVTRKDVEQLINCINNYRIVPEVTRYPLDKANEAILDLKKGSSKGAKILLVSE